MFSHNGKISSRQVMILLVLTMLNMNLLILPRITVSYGGRDGYILPLLSIIIGVILVFIITSLTVKFPEKTFVEMSKELLPNWIAYILILIFALEFIIGTAFELRMFCELVHRQLLPDTPIEAIMILMLLCVAYLIKSGIEAIGRMGEMLNYFIIIPLAIILVIAAFKVDYRQLLPFMHGKGVEMLQGSCIIGYIFIPLQFLLMLTGLMREPKQVKKVSYVVVIIVGIIAGILTLFTISQIGETEVMRQIWPVLGFMKSVGIDNSTVENQQVFVMIIWLFSVFTFISLGIYFCSLLGSRTFKFKRENILVLPLIPIIYFIAITMPNLATAFDWYLKFQFYCGWIFTLVVPIILLIIAKIRKVGANG